jgi:hypothetical protein
VILCLNPVTTGLMRVFHTGFPLVEIAESAKLLYNLESLPLFDRPHEYGYITVFINYSQKYTVKREELEPFDGVHCQ